LEKGNGRPLVTARFHGTIVNIVALSTFGVKPRTKFLYRILKFNVAMVNAAAHRSSFNIFLAKVGTNKLISAGPLANKKQISISFIG
jgi:hypothetical protein